MISSKKEYREYLLSDKRANNIKRKYPIVGYDYIWIYLRILRRLEYKINCKSNNVINKILVIIDTMKLRQYSVKLGITILPNSFGKGLTLWHYGSIIVNQTAKGGDYVTLQSGINISENVVLGNDVYIAPGAKILSNVLIADAVIIGANSVVTKNIEEKNTTWVGIPAKKISNEGYIRRSESI
ncbi:MAG: serine O-acetyltransferase [Herbinix sp.]|nr:serine O-acetyltransferase [Herbinix sp.]